MAKGFSLSGDEQSFVGVYEYLQDARDGLQLPLNRAINFRHWLAHGRYWLHRSEKFNFNELYEIAELMENSLPLKK